MYELLIAKGFALYYWQDLTDLFKVTKLVDLPKEITEFRITFKHTVTGEEKEYRGSIPLTDLEDTRTNDTIQDWCVRWGSRQLYGMDVITDWSTINKTNYCNAMTSGYNVLAGRDNIHPDNLTDRLGDYPDLVLTKDGVDFEEFKRKVMVTVNGLLFKPTNQGDYLTIPNGVKVTNTDGVVDVGLWSFEGVSTFEYVDLKGKFDPELDIHEDNQTVKLQLGDTLKDSFWYLVLEGRIFLQETLIRWLDGDKVLLKLKNSDLIGGHIEDYRRLSVEGEVTPTWGGELTRKEGITKLLEHPNSFIIKFHRKAKLYVDYTALTPSGTKDKYLHMGAVDDPIMRPDNRMVGGYVTHNGDPTVPHVISVVNSKTPKFWEQTGVDVENTLVTGTETPTDSPRSRSLFLSRVYSLEDKSEYNGTVV